ncbi:MAG: hypothetical protein II779_00170, partial [Clostridia bacterium]|nr:hypothetical protein [Clostridia bacterium]
MTKWRRNGTLGGFSGGESPRVFYVKYWVKKELLHVKHYPQTPVFLDPREDRQSDPAAQTRDNAECAPESPAEPAGLVLRMFRLHDRRSSAVVSMFRLVQSAI